MALVPAVPSDSRRLANPLLCNMHNGNEISSLAARLFSARDDDSPQQHHTTLCLLTLVFIRVLQFQKRNALLGGHSELKLPCHFCASHARLFTN